MNKVVKWKKHITQLLIVTFVLVLAINVRLWTLNMMGRTFDEENIVEKGYDYVQLAKHLDFSNKFWYEYPDHPPLSNYLYGIASVGDFERFDKHGSLNFASTPFGGAIFHYDLTYARLVSVFFSSLAVVLVFLIGARYLSVFAGAVAGVVLALIPHFLGYSQLVTHESLITFFFTATVFAYLLYFEKKSVLLLGAAGILTGLTLALKQSNVLLFVVLVGLFWLRRYFYGNEKPIRFAHIVLICVIGASTCVLLWPAVFHLTDFIAATRAQWFSDSQQVPELIFGIHKGAPFFFYVLAFMVTTPLLVLLLTLVGITVALKKRSFIFCAILLWFIVPFLLSVFHERQMMVRYIIEFNAPLSLLAAIGLEYLLNRVAPGKSTKYIVIAVLSAYLLVILVRISPYYLDYYNELVGGTTTVYTRRLFLLGEWGQGLRNPGRYIAEHAASGSVIGTFIAPGHTMFQSQLLRYEPFNPARRYSYVIVNTNNLFRIQTSFVTSCKGAGAKGVHLKPDFTFGLLCSVPAHTDFFGVRIGFDEHALLNDYTIVYTEKADGAVLARVYKHR